MGRKLALILVVWPNKPMARRWCAAATLGEIIAEEMIIIRVKGCNNGDWYVNEETGNDNNNGSKNTPFDVQTAGFALIPCGGELAVRILKTGKSRGPVGEDKGVDKVQKKSFSVLAPKQELKEVVIETVDPSLIELFLQLPVRKRSHFRIKHTLVPHLHHPPNTDTIHYISKPRLKQKSASHLKPQVAIAL